MISSISFKSLQGLSNPQTRKHLDDIMDHDISGTWYGGIKPEKLEFWVDELNDANPEAKKYYVRDVLERVSARSGNCPVELRISEYIKNGFRYKDIKVVNAKTGEKYSSAIVSPFYHGTFKVLANYMPYLNDDGTRKPEDTTIFEAFA